MAFPLVRRASAAQRARPYTSHTTAVVAKAAPTATEVLADKHATPRGERAPLAVVVVARGVDVGDEHPVPATSTASGRRMATTVCMLVPEPLERCKRQATTTMKGPRQIGSTSSSLPLRAVGSREALPQARKRAARERVVGREVGDPFGIHERARMPPCRAR